MKKRLQREIDADSDDDDGNIRDISCPKVVELVKSPPPSKRSRKDKFLNGESSSEDEMPIPKSAEEKDPVLPPQSKEVFDVPNFFFDKHQTELTTRKEASKQYRGVNNPTESPRFPSSTNRTSSTSVSLISPITTDNDFSMDDCKPAFTSAFSRANEEIILGKDNSQGLVYKINQYVARYLIDHQVEGIQWMFGKYAANDSAILGDDMGMGKTVQMAGLLNVIFMKSGTIDDKFIANYKRSGTLIEKLGEFTSSKSQSINKSPAGARSFSSLVNSTINKENLPIYKFYAKSKPVLIMCPKSLVDNWERELKTWGYFIVDVLSAIKLELNEDIFLRAKSQRSEVVLVSYSLVDRFIDELKEIQWDLIVFDEGHKLKNEKSKSYKNIMQIKNCSCRILLTGTPVQNHLKELWALFNLIFNGQFASKAEFVRDIEKPIKRGMSAKATSKAIKLRKQATKVLHSLLKQCLLQRHKTMLQGHHALKGKDEIIVFCDLSPLQQVMYEQCLACPDFDNVRYYATLCPCQSGELRSRCCPQYKVPLRRNASTNGKFAKQNDHSNTNNAVNLDIDPRAILWRQFHPNGQPCEGTILLSYPELLKELEKQKGISSIAKNQTRDNIDDDDEEEENDSNDDSEESDGNAHQAKKKHTSRKEDKNKNKIPNPSKRITCPLCMLLPCLNKLGKIACHPALLQSDPAKQSPFKQRQAEEFLTHAFDASVVSALGGVQRSMRFMTMKSTQDSGKMKTLLEMLRFFMHHGDKTLIFSLSTQVLDLLEAMIKSEGWRFSRLDGQTAFKKRQQMVDEFNLGNQSSYSTGPVSIFLMSSRAGGLGLNLSTANKVIIFDVDWNPTVDMQSQDRAYRIGQKDHVTVYRLVAKGTVEELAYMRQLYKQQLQQAVLGNKDNQDNTTNEEVNGNNTSRKGIKRGPFEGVEGESNMRGELFGVENLFQFSKTSILQALRARYRRKSTRVTSSSVADSSHTDHLTTQDKLPVSVSPGIAIAQNPTNEMDTILERSMPREEVASLLADQSLLNITTYTPQKATPEGEDVDNTADAYQLLQSIGIRLKDARKNEDLLTSHGDIDEELLIRSRRKRKNKNKQRDFINDDLEESENSSDENRGNKEEEEDEDEEEESDQSSLLSEGSDQSENERNGEDSEPSTVTETSDSDSETSDMVNENNNNTRNDNDDDEDLFFDRSNKPQNNATNFLRRRHSLLRPHPLLQFSSAPSKGITDIITPPKHAPSKHKAVSLRKRHPTKALKDVFASPATSTSTSSKAGEAPNPPSRTTTKLHRPQYQQSLSLDIDSDIRNISGGGGGMSNRDTVNNSVKPSADVSVRRSDNITVKNDRTAMRTNKDNNKAIVNLLDDNDDDEEVTPMQPQQQQIPTQPHPRTTGHSKKKVHNISLDAKKSNGKQETMDGSKNLCSTERVSDNNNNNNSDNGTRTNSSSVAADGNSYRHTNGSTSSTGVNPAVDINTRVAERDNRSSSTNKMYDDSKANNTNNKGLSMETMTLPTPAVSVAAPIPKKTSKLYVPNYT